MICILQKTHVGYVINTLLILHYWSYDLRPH